VCFDECEYVRLSITVQTAALRSAPYTERQMELYRHVLRMREVERLTYRNIASRLRASGFRSTRGKELSEELVFSIHKKGPAARSSRSVLKPLLCDLQPQRNITQNKQLS
jgi:hypothetical protein